MNRFFAVSLLLLLIIVVLGPSLAPFDPFTSQLEKTLLPPGSEHLLGTDANGKDIFSLILYSARLSLFISICVVASCVSVGVFFGYLSGYFGGITDRVFLCVADVFQAFPGILLAIAVAAFIPPGLFNLILLLAFVGWVGYARVVRAQVLELKNREFVMAGRALGVTGVRLLWRHLLPNMAGPLIVQASFGMAGVILAESSLSFLGLGLPADTPSLGKMLDSGVNLLLIAPHVSIFPGAAIMLFVLIFNLVGDALRDRLVLS